jgi:uncharacterized protein
MSEQTETKVMKPLDCVTYALMIIGALNWGLIGLFNFNLVAFLFGPMSVLTRIIYVLVGLSALYDIIELPAMVRRWHVRVHSERIHPTAA